MQEGRYRNEICLETVHRLCTIAISGRLFARAYELAKADHEAIANNNMATAQNSVLDALSKEMKGLLDMMPMNKESKKDAHIQLETIIENTEVMLVTEIFK